jgi:recombination protein RecA
LIDLDRSFGRTHTPAIGIDPDRLLLAEPEHAEGALDTVERLVLSGKIVMVAIDSAAAFSIKVETEVPVSHFLKGQHRALLLNAALRKLLPAAHKSGTTLLFVNQIRRNSGLVFGSNEVSTSGSALRCYASIRLDVRCIEPVKIRDHIVGQRIRVKVLKNKLSVPFRKAEMNLRWGTGIDHATELLEVGAALRVVENNNGQWCFRGEPLGSRKSDARERLLDNPELAHELREVVLATSERRARAADRDAAPTPAVPAKARAR